jgi:hypothetical protein
MQPVRARKRPVTAIAGVVTLTVAAIAPPATAAGSPAGRTIAAVVGSIPEPMALSRLAAAPVSGIAAVTVTPAAVKSSGPKAVAAKLPPSVRPAAAHRPSPPPTQPASARLQVVEAVADSSHWDWRRAGVVIHAGFHPQDCCHWGIYDSRDSSIWIGPSAFANPARLRYTVLHELGHGWQWRSGRLRYLSADMAPWGHRSMVAGLEAGADCLSVVWGAGPKAGHYWACPPGAIDLVARRLGGDWSSPG